jgi:hypothetical protein
VSARIEEIRQENRSGDVSFRDIEWLCERAEQADRLEWELVGIEEHLARINDKLDVVLKIRELRVLGPKP